jgi:hypothetical protein
VAPDKIEESLPLTQHISQASAIPCSSYVQTVRVNKIMKNIRYLVYLTLCLISCNSPEVAENIRVNDTDRDDTLNLLVGNTWNIVVAPSDTFLYRYNKQPLYFKEETTYETHFKKFDAYFFDQEIARLAINGDTIALRDTSYLQELGHESKKLVKTYFVGKIEKISRDSLIINKIGGKGLPFFYANRFVFYNDSLDYNKNIKLNRIIYSASSCLGNCPVIALEIDSKGNYKFFGGKHSKHKGNYKGKLDQSYIKEIEEVLRYSNLEVQPAAFPLPLDAPMSEMIIYYNDSLRMEMHGWLHKYTPRLQRVAELIHGSHLKAVMQSVNEQLSFETTAHKREF